MVRRFLRLVSVAAVLVGLTASVQLVQAVPISGLFNVSGDTTLLSDNSADLVIQRDGNDTINAGDILIAIVGINTIDDGTGDVGIGLSSSFNELTGISAVKIVSDAMSVVTNAQGIDLGIFEAEALDAGDIAFFDWSTGSILGGLFTFDTSFGATNDGELFTLVYEDPLNDFDRSGTIQTGLSSASNGAPRFAMSLIGANGDFFQTFAPVDVTTFPATPNTQVALSSLALDATITAQSFPGLLLDEQITGGNGGFASTSVGSGFPIFDNLDFTVTASAVPEPTTITLFGLGLIGLGIIGARRRKS